MGEKGVSGGEEGREIRHLDGLNSAAGGTGEALVGGRCCP